MDIEQEVQQTDVWGTDEHILGRCKMHEDHSFTVTMFDGQQKVIGNKSG